MEIKNSIWMVRAGKAGFAAEEFIKKEIAAIGWNNLALPKKHYPKDAIKEQLSFTYPEYSTRQVSAAAGQIFRFYEEFKINDTVITYNPKTRKYHIGIISSDVIYDVDFSLNKYRIVKWNSEDTSRDVLSIEAKKSLSPLLSIFKIPEVTLQELQNKTQK